jgi:hypothetical protein
MDNMMGNWPQLLSTVMYDIEIIQTASTNIATDIRGKSGFDRGIVGYRPIIRIGY